MKDRIKFIDIVKGISILLIIFSHSRLMYYYADLNTMMGLFRMPLFLFISGVFFNPFYDIKYFIYKKSDALLKPYFSSLLFLLFVSAIFQKKDILQQAIGILYGNSYTIRWASLWYLTHLWAVFVLAYMLFRYIKLEKQSNIIKIFFVIFFIYLGSLYLSKFKKISIFIFDTNIFLCGLPFSIDLAFFSLAYLISGFFLSRKVVEFIPKKFFFFLATTTFILIANYTDAKIIFNARVYDNPVVSTLAAFCGIYIVLTISYYANQNEILKKIFTFFGSASLFLLIFHQAIEFKIYFALLNVLGESFHLLCKTLSFIMSAILPVYISKIFLKSNLLMLFYFPLEQNKLLHPR
ncbi:MAG: acyltransferase family protein [Candidatus Brocadiae bacterium]|nr:acyltransferase family protein [Candidatus Brocadiia bacterium]